MKLYKKLFIGLILLSALSFFIPDDADINHANHNNSTKISIDDTDASIVNVENDKTINSESTKNILDNNSSKTLPKLEFHLLDVGQGTSILIKCGNHWLLYDGGNSETSSYVVSYLKKQSVKKLDYIIASHYDSDHISGLVGALNVFDCDTVLMPDYEDDTHIYDSFMKHLNANGAESIHPEQGETYSFGKAKLDVVGPFTYSYSADNNRSVCIKLIYGDTSFLMCGDAESQAEADMIKTEDSLKADVFVVNHHGSGYSNTKHFLSEVHPKYALISCEKGNRYGHPAKDTMEHLKDLGCKLYRTDLQDDIVLYSDGHKITVNQKPTKNWKSGDELVASDEKSQQDSDSKKQEYICNTNTMKFHYPSCNSVKMMKDKNKKVINGTREEAIRQGFKSCGNCHP